MHLSLTNFITYDRIDVSPGPHMNMIIGPNGTGKSSIVCAIALGLGENTSVMKRAKDISEFVKHGQAQGSIEITLAAGGSGKGSVRIRRDIQREGNKSHWKIDGRTATFGDVQRLTRDLRIQVNNLCQFLPQDRVVEFSKMSAQALLKQTQAAVGREDLHQLQEELVKRRAQERQAMSESARLRSDAETLRKQTALLERDVQRWQEREAAQSQLRVLTALVPVARYAESKAAFDAAKAAKTQAHSQYLAARDAAAEDSGTSQQLAQLEEVAARHEAARRGAGDKRKAAEQGARAQVARLERLDAAQAELASEVDGVRAQARRRQEKVAQLRAEVARLEAAMEGEQPVESVDDRRASEALRERRLALMNDLVALGDEQKALMSAGRAASGDIERRSVQLRALDDQALRRREELRRFHDESARALEWLEANRGLFAQHVFGPVCVEAAVRDPRYAAAIETVVGKSSLRTFVTQSDADYHVFTREINDGLRLRVSVVSAARLAVPPPPHARDAVVALGFGGWAADFVDAPRAVLAFLCSRDRLHAVPLALGAVDHAAVGALGLR
ncbi:Structural maintenance of chromosomes protein 5, partial [Coemansia aciculifera]